MIYVIAKLAQAAGLVIILYAFLAQFPKLMNPKILLVGLLFFSFGWIVEQFLLKK